MKSTLPSASAVGWHVTKYENDATGREKSVTLTYCTSNATTTTCAYDNASNVATVTYPNGVQTVMQYDPLNRVTALATQTTGYNYQRDAVGNLQNVLELSNRQVNWTYDGIYRLTGETIASAPSGKNGAVTYGLDPVGNRLSEVSGLGGVPSGSFTYNPDDEAASETYDPNGNVTAAGGKTFAYDSQNQMISANGGAVQIIYDAFGNRVAKTVSGVTTRYLVEDDMNPTGLPQVFDELNGSGVVTRTYTYGLQRISEEQVINSTWTPSFYGYDGMGSVRNLTNAAGAVTDTWEYDAFGNPFTTSGTTPNEMLYRGEQYDSDLGLYYLRARYYNPLTGRFMSRDAYMGVPRNPETLHKYLYSGGDPVNRIDPSGREDLAEYGVRLAKSLKGTVILNAINCGIGIGSALATGSLIEALGGDQTSTAFLAFGCLTMTVEGGSKITVGLDAIALAGCGWGLYQAYEAENEYFADPTEANLQKVDAGLVGGIGGCAVTLAAVALE